MTAFSIESLHTVLGFSSLGLGAIVFLARKGTPRHKIIGRLYAGSMVGLNLSAFGIYQLFGGFGIFHWFALLSIATIIPAYLIAILRNRIRNWLAIHYELMAWSYVGLLGASSNEAFLHIPILYEIALQQRWLANLSVAVIMVVGAICIYTNKSIATNFLKHK